MIDKLDNTVIKIEPKLGSKSITTNGTYKACNEELEGYSEVDVNIQPKLLKKVITENGTYKATDEGIDGYSEIDVSVGDVNDYFSDNPSINLGSSCSGVQYFIKKLPSITWKYWSCDHMLSDCRNLEEISNITFTNDIKDMSFMFNACVRLKKIPFVIDSNKITSVRDMFYNCISLELLSGLQNLGQSYDITKTSDYVDYRLNLTDATKLTHDSLMNVINNLYDIKTRGCNTQSLRLGNSNISKLTSEEIAIATEKGWTVS